jgi:sporulation protein YlmC with PRC-barrel domain
MMENSMKYAALKNRPKPQAPPMPSLVGTVGSEITSASALEGAPVLNIHEEVVGEVAHIMIDVHSGNVAYIVIAGERTPGRSGRLLPIPRASLLFDAAHNRFILDIDHEGLENAPSFDREHWPVMSDLEWATQVHDYYGQRNYWLRPSGQPVPNN